MTQLSPSFSPNPEYKEFINSIKSKIKSAQIKAAIRVNTEQTLLYWEIGEEIIRKQAEAKWGDGLIKQMEFDLKLEFPNQKGFSRTNLFYMRRMVVLFRGSSIVPQVVGQIPWGHVRYLIDNFRSVEETQFYIQETLKGGWGRSVLEREMDTSLYQRQGRAVNNFQLSLPNADSDLAKQTLKSSYLLDFLGLTQKYTERELEDALARNVTRFLTELGKGFAYVGRQHKLEVNRDEFYIDLLFFHIELERYVALELKVGKFDPKDLGQLSFYMSTIDTQYRKEKHGSTIGLLLCKEKNDLVVEIALQSYKGPIGVADYKTSLEIPDEIRAVLPTLEEFSMLELLPEERKEIEIDEDPISLENSSKE